MLPIRAVFACALLSACNESTDTGRSGETDADADGFALPDDGDDTLPQVHPGATEVCNALEDDWPIGASNDLLPLVGASVGDTDGDGYADLLVRNMWAGASSQGAAYLFRGSSM
jgi:hypothetical protein